MATRLTAAELTADDVDVTVPLSTWEALPERVRTMFHWYAANGEMNGGRPEPMQRTLVDGTTDRAIRFTGIPAYRWAEICAAAGAS